MKRYTEREKTRFEHQWEIRRARGYREFADAEEEFSGWVAARSRATGNGPKAIFTDGVAWLRPDGLPAALPAPERLAAVRATGLLDTGPEGPFDDLARLAGAATAPGRTRRGGNQGASPALALISVPQQGRRLDTTPPVKDPWAGRIRSASAARAPAGPYSDSLTHIHPRDSSCTGRTR